MILILFCSRDVFDRMGTADSSLMTGEKCFKWSQVTTTATWKLMRSVERRVKGQGPRLANAETQIQGLCLMLLFLVKLIRHNYRTDPRKPGSAGAKRRTGEESDPPGKEDHSSNGRTPS